MIDCKYYKKENKEESRCVKDSTVGYCIVEKYRMECKNEKGYKRQSSLSEVA